MRPPRNHGQSLSFDIFCRVIDNFGDIGVCWRLARQLAQAPHHHRVRLWVDDLARFQCLEPDIHTALARQELHGIQVMHWTGDISKERVESPGTANGEHGHHVGNVVIEAFGCNVPQPVISAMQARDSLWLNLEYLSAEPWVDDFHLQPSMQPGGLRKFFFFPGFTPKTGGLLREAGLIEARDAWQARPSNRHALLQSCGLSDADLHEIDRGARLIFVFCYPDAPVPALADTLADQGTPAFVLIPDSVYSHYEQALPHNRDHVRIRRLPFVRQAQFDRLLWSCDLNIVRGEDSLVRAIWAGRPMIWQPYPQSGDSHLVKLDAWLQRSPLHPDTRALIRSWTTHDVVTLQQHLHQHLQGPIGARWARESRTWSQALARQTDLATALTRFCLAASGRTGDESCAGQRTTC